MFWPSKRKRFIRALEKEDARTANSLIESGIDVNAVVEGQTLVHWAVRYKRADTLSALIRAGADISRETIAGTPLSEAIRSGSPTIVKILIDAGADISRETSAGTPLSEAIRSRSPTTTKILIDAGALKHERDAGRSLLMDAIASKCNDKVFDMLLTAGIDVATSDSDGTPALISALHPALRHAVVLLVKHGADVNVEYEGRTALMIAAERGLFHAVQEMLSAGAKVNQTDQIGFTALDYAELEDHSEVSQALREAGGLSGSEMSERALAAAGDDSQVSAMIDNGLRLADAMFEALREGRSDLAVAVIRAARNAGTDELSRCLLSALELSASRDVLAALIQAGAEFNCANDEGEFPLHIAAREGSCEAIKLLVASGASSGALDADSRTPLMVALLAGEGEAVKTLIEHGARLNTEELRGKTSQDLLFEMPIPDGQSQTIVEERRSIRLMLEEAHEGLAGPQAGEPSSFGVHIEGLGESALYVRLSHLSAILAALETEPDRVATEHLRKLVDIRRSRNLSVIGLFGTSIDGGEAFSPGRGFHHLHYAIDLAEWQLEQRAD